MERVLLDLIVPIIACCIPLVLCFWKEHQLDRKVERLRQARQDMRRGFQEAKLLIQYGAMEEGIDLIVETTRRVAPLLHDSQE